MGDRGADHLHFRSLASCRSMTITYRTARAYYDSSMAHPPPPPSHLRQWLGDLSSADGTTRVAAIDTTQIHQIGLTYQGARDNLYLVERLTRKGPDLLFYQRCDRGGT